MYQKAFTAFFQTVEERSGQPVRWQHLHARGFYGITVDMDTKQMAGKLNRFTIDPRSFRLRIWEVPRQP